MTWNLRVWQETADCGDESYDTFSIRETYYNKAGEIWACSAEPDDVIADSLQELKDYVKRIEDAVTKGGVLYFNEFVFAERDE